MLTTSNYQIILSVKYDVSSEKCMKNKVIIVYYITRSTIENGIR